MRPKEKEAAEKYQQDRLHNPEYVDFDEFGMKEVRCMRCSVPIRVRSFLEVEGEKVMALKTLSHYAIIPRPSGSILCCTGCLPMLQQLDADTEARVNSQVLTGYVKELIQAKHSDEYITSFVASKSGEATGGVK